MTGRDRARKCTIYLRMYIVSIYHSAYHLQTNVLLAHILCCMHTRVRARRYFLFRASPNTRPASDLSRFFLDTLFFMHFSRTHRLHPALHTCILFHTHSRVCIAEIYIRTNKCTCIYSGTREQSVHEKWPRFCTSFICWPNVHHNAALKFSQFVCQRASWSSSSLLLLVFS